MAIVNPLFAFSFLESLLDILRNYLGDVTETTIKDNFDIVYMASVVWIQLSDCINSLLIANWRDSWWGTSHDDRDGDVEGNRSSSKLGPEDIRCSRCFWVSILQVVLGQAKMLSWFILSCSLQSTTTAPFTAPIPWRRPGVRHNNNEIYFDIEECLDAIVDRYVVSLR